MALRHRVARRFAADRPGAPLLPAWYNCCCAGQVDDDGKAEYGELRKLLLSKAPLKDASAYGMFAINKEKKV